VLAAFAAYSLGDLNLQNGWDGGIVAGNPVPFTNNNAGSDIIVNSIAFSGTQSWQYGGSYGSPGAGTPFTPQVATVGALNATLAGSPITPAGNKSVVSFAFMAAVPGDGSRINVYEGSYARDDRTGASLYLENSSANGNPAGTVSLFNFSSANDAPDCNTSQVNLGWVTAGVWHTVEMTTVYPNLTVGDPSTYGSTTYVFDKGTLSEQTATMQSWAHAWRNCNGFNYTPGGSLKWSSSFNDYPTHMGFYIDDVSMKVINTATQTTVGSFATSFEANPLTTTISINNIPTSAVVGGSFTPTYTYTGDGTTSVTSSTTGTCTVSGGLVNFVGVGTCTLTAHATAGTIYAAVDGSPQSFTITINDTCPNDPNKTAPGACGCGVPDTDSDGDGIPDCHEPADLRVTKTAKSRVKTGTKLTYVVTVRNNGPNAAPNVVITDAVPAGTTFVSADPTRGSCSHAGNLVTCNIGTLANHRSAAIIIVVKVTAPNGTILNNTAQGSSSHPDPNLSNNADSAKTKVVKANDDDHDDRDKRDDRDDREDRDDRDDHHDH
jgi:uncharacterized repeat protein (TIGR01451 family)